jgi:four helix bundle protein
MRVDRFEDLKCWKSARSLVKAVFIACKHENLKRDFEVQNQLKRASLSIMNNIAEGFARFHTKDFIRFLNIAQASASEVKSMLYVLEDLSYLTQEQLKEIHQLTDESRKLTLGLIRYLKSRNDPSQTP